LAAGLCPDPLWSFSAPPDSLAAIWGLLLRVRGGEEEGKGRRRDTDGITTGCGKIK